MVNNLFFLNNTNISTIGFIEDDFINVQKNHKCRLYPIYKIKGKSYQELLELLKDQQIKDFLYKITINKLIKNGKHMDNYKQYLQLQYFNSKQLFEEFIKVWLKNILQNPHIQLLPNLNNEIIFYIY